MSPERALPTVLVVDDSGADRRLAGGLLERSGSLAVEYANDGKEAIDRFQSHVPDLVVTDLIMPEMDGLALVATVKSEFPLVPVVLMTARGNEEIALGALRGSGRLRPQANPRAGSRPDGQTHPGRLAGRPVARPAHAPHGAQPVARSSCTTIRA